MMYEVTYTCDYCKKTYGPVWGVGKIPNCPPDWKREKDSLVCKGCKGKKTNE